MAHKKNNKKKLVLDLNELTSKQLDDVVGGYGGNGAYAGGGTNDAADYGYSYYARQNAACW